MPSDARHSLLRRLIDFAGLSPPARLGMEDAVAAYREAALGHHAWMLDRFICPASRLSELAGLLEDGERFRLAVVVDDADLGDADALAPALAKIAGAVEDAGGALVAQLLEVRLAGGDPEPGVRALREALTATSLPEPVRTFVEVPADEGLDAALDALAAGGVAAKVRCATPTVVPSPDALAAFVAGCAARDLSWKATAGLHHPFRHRDEATGHVQHGFLNVLAAAGLAAGEAAPDGPAPGEATPAPADAAALAEALADDNRANFALDAAGLRWRRRRVDAGARTRFVGYGSCSFDEPIEDLDALGALPAAGPEEEAPARA